MNTHFHLVIQTPNHETLSKNIAYLKWHYSLWMRKKYNWKGPLWRERYKSLPIEYETQSGTAHQSYLHQVHQGDCHLGVPKQLDFRSSLLKNIFSYSPAIGTPFFIENFKQSQNDCPKK